MRVSRDCWKCEYEECGWIWLAAGDEAPAKCAKCRKRRWHTPGLTEIIRVGQARVEKKVGVVKAIPAVKPAAVIPVPARAETRPSCPSCGSIGQHQKWCEKGKAK